MSACCRPETSIAARGWRPATLSRGRRFIRASSLLSPHTRLSAPAMWRARSTWAVAPGVRRQRSSRWLTGGRYRACRRHARAPSHRRAGRRVRRRTGRKPPLRRRLVPSAHGGWRFPSTIRTAPDRWPEIARVRAPAGVLVIYDFSCGRRCREAPLDAWFDAFESRYPFPPGYAMDVQALDYAHAGLRLAAFEPFDIDLPLTLEEYWPTRSARRTSSAPFDPVCLKQTSAPGAADPWPPCLALRRCRCSLADTSPTWLAPTSTRRAAPRL